MYGFIYVSGSKEQYNLQQYNFTDCIVTLEVKQIYDNRHPKLKVVSVTEPNTVGTLLDLKPTNKSEIRGKKGKKLKNWNKNKFWQKGR